MTTPSNAEGLAIALERIRQEGELQTGFLDLGRLGLTSLPDMLFSLSHLSALNLGSWYSDQSEEYYESTSKIETNRIQHALVNLQRLPNLRDLFLSGTDIFDLSPLARLVGLQILDCGFTQINDLSPLAGLVGLQKLDCGLTSINNLSPLAGLVGLQRLDCCNNQVSDLLPLAGMTGLQRLYCSGTQVSDLTPLAGMTGLQRLYCGGTQVSDLSPLIGLASLQKLNCSHTQINDLSPLAALFSLQSLYCCNNQVNDLSPLAGLVSLQKLDCNYTQIDNLSPLADLVGLKELGCNETPISDLSPLIDLPDLEELWLSYCNLKPISAAFWQRPSLKELYLYQSHISGIPDEVMSQDESENCLDSLRAHLCDLEAGSQNYSISKFLVLGNGRVGKTQLCRRLREESYDDTVPSTHGITVSRTVLKKPVDDGHSQLQLWDFGGQDIYHGTHALFLKSRAIFAVVWSTESNNASIHEHLGFHYKSFPLSYWLAFVRGFGDKDSPVLMIQTRCDKPEDEELQLPVSRDEFNRFQFKKSLHFSALNGRGITELNVAVSEAVDWLGQHCGMRQIGVGRYQVQRLLEVMLEEDAKLAPEQRIYRTLSQTQFRALCDEAGGISSVEHFLSYLHESGTVFYRAGLFQERIILDQAWALDAIYTVFNREKCYQQLRHLKGRFTRSLLELLVWKDYGTGEQQLFLDMMVSCGICLVFREGDEEKAVEAEYIAAELLPDRDEIATELEEKWDCDGSFESAVFEYQIHHPGLLRGLVAKIGTQAGANGIYWKDGVCVYEKTTRSRALIEQEALEDWRGCIRIQTQGGQSGLLLEKLVALIRHQHSSWGLNGVKEIDSSPNNPHHKLTMSNAENDLGHADLPVLVFGQETGNQPEYCVSYAWGDLSPEGKEREVIVDRLCEAAKKRGKLIVRDKNELGLGDCISKFMMRIGRADRVFIILSDKYLKSPYCMFELFEVWRNCRQDDEEFMQHIRVFTLPCAQIFSSIDRAQYAIHWKNQHDKLKGMIETHGADILGERDFKEYKLMQDFAHRVGDVLKSMADRIQPNNFAELEEYGLAD